MAARARNRGSGERFARLGLHDFLPAFSYRDSEGRPDLWINWPVVVALVVGFAVAKFLGV